MPVGQFVAKLPWLAYLAACLAAYLASTPPAPLWIEHQPSVPAYVRAACQDATSHADPATTEIRVNGWDCADVLR